MLKKSIENFVVKNKRVLVRCDFNVPVKDGVIIDSARILASLKTIHYLLDNGAKVILMSHFGRPKGVPNKEYSLEFVAKYLEAALGQKILFMDDDRVVSPKTKALVDKMNSGDVVLLQNTRFRKEEETNDDSFSKELADLGDIFINDAFGTSHRAHCSTVGVAKYLPSGLGFLMKKEVEILESVMENPKRPFVAILGGSKVTDKIGAINNLINKVDTLIIGGAMMFTFYKALGYNIGKSLVEDDKVSLAKEILALGKQKGVEIILPEDVVVADKFSNDANWEIVDKENIGSNVMGLDIGPKSVKEITDIVMKAKTIIWNGPMGVFEMNTFAKGTFGVADALANSDAITVIGGGDSAAAIDMAGLANKMTHISTGGGASIEFMEGKILPGIAVLDNRSRVPFICGNWKMNTTLSEGLKIVSDIKNEISDDKVKVAICPPFTHLDRFGSFLMGSYLTVGAQNVNAVDSGSLTGEISVSMLKDLMVEFCIVGHSERRINFGETDDLVNIKAKKLLEHNITPIICCGEPLEVRRNGLEKEYVKQQIVTAFKGITKKEAIKVKIAYEPIWAIGTGNTASTEEANSMCLFIRDTINSLDFAGEEVAILYGGSVNITNIKSLIKCENIDGALIGGASLNKYEFINIINECK
ncbi:MAG: triose-phosphate isomerase [Firmicutes bacterium]|nr:triose-phosphate isomerase [Bacillota bacterium]